MLLRQLLLRWWSERRRSVQLHVFLAARLWRSRAIRFCARAFSVTFPLALDLVVVVLELRANDALERTRLETKKNEETKTKCHWNHCHLDTLENSLSPLSFR